MTAAGYIDGYEDGTFRPDGNVSVAEFVTIVARCLGLETGAEIRPLGRSPDGQRL